MRNTKQVISFDNELEGVKFFEHIPTRIRFASMGQDPTAYLKDCKSLTREECDHLTVLADFAIQTSYQFANFEFRVQCPAQMKTVLTIVKEASNLQMPDIVITESMFNHIYGMDRT